MLEVFARIRDIIIAIALAWVGVSMAPNGSDGAQRPGAEPAAQQSVGQQKVGQQSVGQQSVGQQSAAQTPVGAPGVQCPDAARASTVQCIEGADCPHS